MILFTPSVALGWGRAGHQIMAEIAARRLNSNAKSQIRELLYVKVKLAGSYSTPDFVAASFWGETKGFSELVRASTWADEIKTFPGYRQELSQLHFIENPFPNPGSAPAPNIVTALKEYVKTLQTSTDMQAKAKALRFIIHFVGDIHQPLHCAVRFDNEDNGDQGGNRVSILVADSSGRLRPDRLHVYWDEGLNTFVGSTGSLADRIERANPDQPEIDPFNFQGWSDESFKLARNVAYAGIPSGISSDSKFDSKSDKSGTKSAIRVTATYKAKALPVVNQQIAKSGYRLARLLNAIWPDRP